MPIKKYYLLNYIPAPMENRRLDKPYPFTLRLKEFDIEEAYSRPQIVYRQSPYELRYYFYKVWAVKPTRMITDLVHKHLLSVNLVRRILRRFDEGGAPEYELSGVIQAIEEYDSDEIWFAHLAIRITLSRTEDGKILFSRLFDHRKRVYLQDPEYVVREMSKIMELITNRVLADIDETLYTEYVGWRE